MTWLLGIAGAGDSTLGRALAARWRWGYLPMASTSLGLALHLEGLTLRRPRWAVGQSGLEAWLRALALAQERCQGVVVPDVRDRDDAAVIWEMGGQVVSVGPDLGPGVPVFGGGIRQMVLDVEAWLRGEGLDVPAPHRPRLYLGGPVWGAEGLDGGRRSLAEDLAREGFEVVLHADFGGQRDRSRWDELLAEYTVAEASMLLVEEDLGDLHEADAGLFVLDRPSMGSAVEMLAMALEEKPVAVVAPTQLRCHPFLNALGRAFWSLPHALSWLKEVLGMV